jgi:hypothetical protein
MPEPQPNGVPFLPSQDILNAMYDIFGSYPRKNVLPYFYRVQQTTAEGTALAANGTRRNTIRVSSDAAFNCLYFTGASTGAYTLFIRTDSSDRQLMPDAVHSATIVGTAQFPFILPKPLLLAPNTTISFDFTDLTGAANQLWLTLCGFKVYQRQDAM